MSKDEKGGLLGKVARFVRNPTTNWADLDNPSSMQDSGHSQMLKELIERKKRNDFVRKREFDMLRKLRRRELSGQVTATNRPSFFQSSLPSKPAERANTLKKIDEIEAQMSMQWWKTKHRDSMVSSVNSSVFPVSSTTVAPPVTTGREAPPAPAEAPAAKAPAPTALAAAPTTAAAPTAAPVPTAQRAAAGPAPAQPPRKPPPPPRIAVGVAYQETTTSGFSNSKSHAIEVDEVAHDPDLEEACIRFANGDDKGAEAILLDALGRAEEGRDPIELWLTLFDLYRATGQEERFEIAAVDFANQFQRSAPQWFSLPGMVTQLAATQQAGSGAQGTNWNCPARLGLPAITNLKAICARIPSPWKFDWSALTAIETDAVPALASVFTEWASHPVAIHMAGTDRLLELLVANAPSGDRTVDPQWWHLRLALLRVMGRADEFEVAALDYCVTYEVSPPTWEAPRCTFRRLSAEGQLDSEGPTTIIGLPTDDIPTRPGSFGQTDFRSTNLDSTLAKPVVVELSGTLVGDIVQTLETLEKRFVGTEVMSLACSRLIRVDFAAAGALLNWVSTAQTQGRMVQFMAVHRLVAGFFKVLGISDVAHVMVRTD